MIAQLLLHDATATTSREGVRPVPEPLSRILLLLHDGGGVKRVAELEHEIHERNLELGELRERLMDLELIEAISVEDGVVRLRESVVIPYRELGA